MLHRYVTIKNMDPPLYRRIISTVSSMDNSPRTRSTKKATVFGIFHMGMDFCSSTTLKTARQLTATVRWPTGHLKDEIAKNRHPMKKKKLLFQEKTMHRLTNRWNRCWKYTKYISNCYRTYRIHQLVFTVRTP